jgi:ribose transport system substrate-binding protein
MLSHRVDSAERPARLRLVAFFALGLLQVPAIGVAQEAPQGLTTPQSFAPFDANAPACKPPPGLTNSLVFAQDNDREFMIGVAHGLGHAARDRGLDYRAVLANNDPAAQTDQMRKILAERIGAVVVSPVDPVALSGSMQRIMWAGSYVGSIVPPPATLILNAPQFLTGKTLGDAAADYIIKRLGGKAEVVLLTQDSIEFLAPRFVAIRKSLNALPGVTVVADISPNPVSKEGGFATMSLILEAHPNVDVVLGADSVVLGALAALRKAGKARPDQYLGGIDGEPEAVAEIKRGGPYKASIALSSPVFGYAMGIHAADWLKGRSIPQAMDILPVALTAENISSYEMDSLNPGAVYASIVRRGNYLKMYGNICYDTRDRYVNFPWSSEAR